MTTARQARALARAVNHRMQELDIDQRTLSERTGVARVTIRDIQNATGVDHHPRTLGKLSVGLAWPSLALLHVVSATPGQAAGRTTERTIDLERATGDELLARVADLEDELTAIRRVLVERLVSAT